MSKNNPKKFDRAELERKLSRREVIKNAASGALIIAIGGGLYKVSSDLIISNAFAEKRPDGKARLPPGQKVIEALKPMGGQPYTGKPENWSLKIYGEVEKPMTLTWDKYSSAKHVKQSADVHCVTGWSLLGGVWTGLKLLDLAKAVKPKSSARHVIFEAAHGYTANVPIKEALKNNCMITHQLNGRVFARRHGAPVRALIPDLYFWKSAKWITGIRFSKRDEPGYWETRGYHNHADPWKEERYS